VEWLKVKVLFKPQDRNKEQNWRTDTTRLQDWPQSYSDQDGEITDN
jgi:hypothetical protein